MKFQFLIVSCMWLTFFSGSSMYFLTPSLASLHSLWRISFQKLIILLIIFWIHWSLSCFSAFGLANCWVMILWRNPAILLFHVSRLFVLPSTIRGDVCLFHSHLRVYLVTCFCCRAEASREHDPWMHKIKPGKVTHFKPIRAVTNGHRKGNYKCLSSLWRWRLLV